MVKAAVFTTIMTVAATTGTTVTTTNTIINCRLWCVGVGQQFLHDWSSQIYSKWDESGQYKTLHAGYPFFYEDN